MTIQNNST